MIIAIGSDKGAPGATTLSVVLGYCWPGDRLVAELDLRGADLPYRLRRLDRRPLAKAPSIATLAVDSRPGLTPPSMERYVQQTSLGVPVLPGVIATPGPSDGQGDAGRPGSASAILARHMPSIASATTTWPGTVIADVGELRASSPAIAVAKRAAVVLLLVRPTVAGLARLWERAAELSQALGDPSRERASLGVVLVAPPGQDKLAVAQAEQLLAEVGSPVPVVGSFAFDPGGAEQLWAGEPSRRLFKSALIKSGQHLSGRIWTMWPELAGQQVWPAMGGAPIASCVQTPPARTKGSSTAGSATSPAGTTAHDAPGPAPSMLGWSAAQGPTR